MQIMQVFVPIMDAISKGSGTQPVYLKLDLNSIVAGKKSTSVSKSSKSKKSSKRQTHQKAAVRRETVYQIKIH